MQRFLIALGILIVAIGITWPWLKHLPIGRLPGDFLVREENFTFYFPLTSLILISVILSLLIWILRRF